MFSFIFTVLSFLHLLALFPRILQILYSGSFFLESSHFPGSLFCIFYKRLLLFPCMDFSLQNIFHPSNSNYK